MKSNQLTKSKALSQFEIEKKNLIEEKKILKKKYDEDVAELLEYYCIQKNTIEELQKKNIKINSKNLVLSQKLEIA